ncbi:hypothetical protein U1Q18_018522 [Sarracenia purpurea var. burkii]
MMMKKNQSRLGKFLDAMDYDFSELDCMLDRCKSYLLGLDPEKKMEIVHRMIKPSFNEADFRMELQKASDHEYTAANSLEQQPRPALMPATSLTEKSIGEKIKLSESKKKTCATIRVDQICKAEEATGVKNMKPVLRLKIGAKRPHAETEYGEEEENKREKKKMVVALPLPRPGPVPEQPPFPDLPARFRGYIQDLKGNNVILVIQKQLQQADLNMRQGRLSIPLSQMRNEFLTSEEKELLNTRTEDGKHVGKIKAQIIEPSENKYSEKTVYLRKWDMPKKSGKVTSVYNLGAGWNLVLKNEDNKLGKENEVQLWSFRVGLDLWFALVKV